MEYIKTDFAPDDGDAPYLTTHKVYGFDRDRGQGGYITADDGERLYIFLDCCAHLNDRNWILCSADGNPIGASH